MGKYDPLADYLRRQRRPEVDLTFRDIERIVGGLLPKAANDPNWWAAGRDAGDAAPQKRAWTSVHFSPRADLRAERVLFVRQAPGDTDRLAAD